MKTRTTKLLTLIIFTSILSSCNVNIFNKVNGNRNVVTEDRSAKENFTKIKVSTGLDVYLTQGSKNKIVVEADENLQDLIITEINNGELKIYSEKNIWSAKAKKIFVTVKTIEAITATSGADVYGKETINTNTLKISTTSGADIKMFLNANTVKTSATSGSDIEIFGDANHHISTATSGASINAYQLHSKNATVKVTSGANIDIYASESINAKATSGGDIDFKGNPKQVDKKSSSGGSISSK